MLTLENSLKVILLVFCYNNHVVFNCSSDTALVGTNCIITNYFSQSTKYHCHCVITKAVIQVSGVILEKKPRTTN